MTIKKMLSCFSVLLGFITMCLVASLGFVNKSQQEIENAKNIRFVSQALAEELRESSRKLTSAIQSYAVTGDERFITAYMDVIDIRSGKKPRPNDYKISPGQTIALSELISNADFTDRELELLQFSSDSSDNLVYIEIEAMNAVRGLFSDDMGGYTIIGEPDKAMAMRLVFGPSYEAEVSKIMEPFTLFNNMLNERLDASVTIAQAAYDRSIHTIWIALSVVIIIFGVFVILVRTVIVRPILLCDIFAKQISKGNFDISLNYSSSNEIGSLANSLQAMLKSLLERISFEEQAERFGAIATSEGAGIIIKDMEGVIVDWNVGAQRIMGYTSEEIIGHTSEVYRDIHHKDEALRINERLMKGESFVILEDHLIHKNGKTLICSTSFSPILNFENKMTGSAIIFNDVTASKLAAQKARNLAAIVSIADAGIIIKDKDGIVREWNIGAENILGYIPEEIIGHTTKYYAPEDGHAGIDEIEERLKKGEHTAHVDVVRKHKNGQLINCSASYTPIFDDDERFSGSVAIFHDVTDKKIAEQKAHKLAAIIAIADAGIIIKNKNGVVQEWNVGAENIFGYKQEEIINHTSKYYSPEEGHDEIDEIEKQLSKGEHIAHVEVVRKHKDGHLVDCSVSYTPIFDDNGKFDGSVAIFHDITASKQATQKAKNMAAIISAADAGIVIKDADCNILEWNVGAEYILGYKPEEIIGKNTKYYVPEDGYAEVDEVKKRLQRGEHTAHIEVVRKHKDGRLIDCSATYTPVFDENGQFVGSVAVFQDISYKKQIEHALNEALGKAEEASRSKSMFLANMSHEIRTPMNGVIGFAELALDESGIPDNIRECLVKIKSSAENLLHIINDILDISKIESGAIILEKIPFDLHNIFKDCETISSLKAAEKGIALHFYSEPFIGKRLLGDPTRLRQVLINLLSNAIKFTNHGMVKLTAIIEEQESDNVQIRIEVKDSGIGMTPEQAKNIFDPFEQADNSTTRKYGGTGLGLTITKSFIEMMGGKLEVDSTQGIGSKFTFTLPFETVLIQEDYCHGPNQMSLLQKPMFKGEVLVCEDNLINQEVVTRHLSRIGLTSVIAMNGKQGLDAVRERMQNGQLFDLILMDIHMPIMDGLEATKKLLEMGNKTPVIAITANAMITDKENYLKHGMSDYLSKPFTAKELWSCLMRHLTPLDITLYPETDNQEYRFTQDTRERKLIVNDILDETAGIEKATGDEQFYRRIQKNFYYNNRSIIYILNEALRENDIKTAYRIAHTLKSSAGLIGAEKLVKAAACVELALLDETGNCPPDLLEKLESAVTEVLLLLEPVLVEDDPNQYHTTEILDKDMADALIKKLTPLLRSGDPESADYVEEVKMILSPLGEICVRLALQMEDYDFDAAYETINSLISQLEDQE